MKKEMLRKNAKTSLFLSYDDSVKFDQIFSPEMVISHDIIRR